MRATLENARARAETLREAEAHTETEPAEKARHRRLGRGHLGGSALCALVGLYAIGTGFTWLDAMIPEGAPWVLASVLAIAGALAMIVVVPLNVLWRPEPRWARYALPIAAGIAGVASAVALWFVAMLHACDAICHPVDTWKMLPSLFACGALTGLGPAWRALADNHPERRGRWWAAAIVLGILGWCVGMYFWVETGVYPEG